MRGICTDPNANLDEQRTAKEVALKIHNNIKKAVEGEVGPIVTFQQG